MSLLLGPEVGSHTQAFPSFSPATDSNQRGLCAVYSETAKLGGMREEAGTAETGQILFLH